MSRFMNSGRFAYALGYKSENAAYEAFCDMCNQGEMTEFEARIESYKVRKEGKSLTRYAITTPA